jgi:hypothetical protein
LLLVVAGSLAIAVATLRPDPQAARRVSELPLSCLVCGDLGGMDVALNLLLFAPVACGLALLGVSTPRITLIAALASLSIETIQFAWLPGRDASLSDLLTNTAGAACFGWLTLHRASILLPNPREAQRLTGAAVVGWIALQCGGAWSLAPTLPPTIYWGQWAPDLGFLEQFHGSVLDARIAGDSVPPHRSRASDHLRSLLLREGGPVSARVILGPPPRALAPIFSVFDGRSTEIFLLGQRRDEAFFRLRTRASTLRLRPPALRLPGALTGPPGDTVALTASYLHGRYHLRVENRTRVTETTLDVTPSMGWAFFMPFREFAIAPAYGWITTLWIAVLLLPLGYWTARASTLQALLTTVVGVAATFTATPWLFDLQPVPGAEWAAAGAGLALGVLLGRAVRAA